MTDPTIAIIGGGIAGLTLAVSLLKRGIKVQIFEKAKAFGEVGAGLAFPPQALAALTFCDERLAEVQRKVSSPPMFGELRDVFLEYFEAPRYSDDPQHPNVPFWVIKVPGGPAGCHRAHFLDGLIGLLPDGVAQLEKKLVDIVDTPGSPVKLNFADGTQAFVDAVIGCDGIGSQVRRLVVGEGHPSLRPSYSHKFVYRMLVPMDDAIKVLGERRAKAPTGFVCLSKGYLETEADCYQMGQGKRLIHFPVAAGAMVNLVALYSDEAEWPSAEKLVLPATKEDVLADFADWPSPLRSLLALAKPQLDRWGLFDLGDHPPPRLAKGRVCIAGDAAHAATPHLGTGAGFALEDVAIITALLTDSRVSGKPGSFEAAFDAYDAVRSERSHWIIQASRRAGNLVDWTAEDVGNDLGKIQEELTQLYHAAWNWSPIQAASDAADELGRQLARRA